MLHEEKHGEGKKEKIEEAALQGCLI